jgi:L-threonylcarbamoyladenylate synthase
MSHSPDILAPTPEGISNAAKILHNGGLVAFPTETVYGLGADAYNDIACQTIFAAKNRPPNNPLIIHLAEIDMIERFIMVSPVVRALAERFWPGPLTIVAPQNPQENLSRKISRYANAGLDTLAIRIPAHSDARALLRAFAKPIAAPSANISGFISATQSDHVLHDFPLGISAVLQTSHPVGFGADCFGIESTIVQWTSSNKDSISILRAGVITQEDIQKIVPVLCTTPSSAHSNKASDHSICAPGQLTCHYAPSTKLKLNATCPEGYSGWLGFGSEKTSSPYLATIPHRNLSLTGNLEEAAYNLFAHLRALDAVLSFEDTIAVAPIPLQGIGVAVNDRLKRAAALKLQI